jgi:zinc transporter 2
LEDGYKKLINKDDDKEEKVQEMKNVKHRSKNKEDVLYFDGSNSKSDDYTESLEDSHNHGEMAENINVRAAVIHIIGDIVQSIGVIIAATIIYFEPGWQIIDPI